MMKKTIGMVLDAFYPADIRVHKEARALINAGFKVALLCKRREGEPYEEVIDGIQLMRIDAGKTHFDKGVMDIVVAVKFIHPVFKRKLPAFIKMFSVDVLHVHDLPLAKTCFLIGRKYAVKIVADFHENYPEALKIWFQWKKNPAIRLKNKIFFNYQRWDAYEKWVINHVDHIIAVVEEMKERILRENTLAQDKITVVSNTEEKSFLNAELNESIYGPDKEKFIIAYTGGVGPHRGVDTAIEAMAGLKEYPEIMLYITGSISAAARAKMGGLINKYRLDEKVKLLGYRPFSEFYSYMKMASVNLIPHHSNGHTDNTVPHKLFQCMMVGRPLIVSSSAPLKRIVNETHSGVVFEAGNPDELAKRILELYNDAQESSELGENGRKATIEGDYNWETTSLALIEFYRNITGS